MEPFLAQLLLVPYNFAPYQWAFCQGQILPISQYSALFSLLGVNFGGNGTSNFGLPDLQGRVAMGQGSGPGLTPRVMGEKSGTETVQLLAAQMPLHSHSFMGVTQGADQPGAAGNALADAANLYAPGTPNVAMNANALGPTGGSGPHNNLMPYLTLNWVIAMVGVYPQRG